jgi:hypothetical protein
MITLDRGFGKQVLQGAEKEKTGIGDKGID